MTSVQFLRARSPPPSAPPHRCCTSIVRGESTGDILDACARSKWSGNVASMVATNGGGGGRGRGRGEGSVKIIPRFGLQSIWIHFAIRNEGLYLFTLRPFCNSFVQLTACSLPRDNARMHHTCALRAVEQCERAGEE